MRPVHVFAGPSLFGVQRPVGIVWHPPAAAGDMLALAGGPPGVIVLIDGLFGTARSPWHKEMLILLAGGTSVIGAASMGALRAAELDRFGVAGVGDIYRAYARGTLVADDAVALLHAPATLDHHPLTLTEVDMRARLAGAVRARAISVARARAVCADVIATHYSCRDVDWSAQLWNRHALPGRAPTPADAGLKHADARAAIALALALARLPVPAARPAMPPGSLFLGTIDPRLRQMPVQSPA